MSRRLMALAAMLFLVACSSTTFFYNRLDFLIPWYMGRYVDLDREQSQYLDQQLLPFLAWHRAEELPRYLELLDQAEVLLDHPVTAADIETLSLSAEEAWLRVEGRALQWMIELGNRLSDSQMEEFVGELRKRQTKYEKKYLPRSEEEYREEAFENLRDSLQDYMGRLDTAQRETLRDAVQGLQRSDGIWLEERARWIDRLETILRREPGWEERLRAAIDTREDTVSEAYNATYENNLRVVHQAIASTINSRNDKQDRRLRREIQDLREDLGVLIEQGQKDDE